MSDPVYEIRCASCHVAHLPKAVGNRCTELRGDGERCYGIIRVFEAAPPVEPELVGERFTGGVGYPEIDQPTDDVLRGPAPATPGESKWPTAIEFIVDSPDDGPEEWCAIPVERVKRPADAIRAAYLAFEKWSLEGLAFIHDGTCWMRPVEEVDHDHTSWENCEPTDEGAAEFHKLLLTDDPDDFSTATSRAEPPSGGAQSKPELHINPHNSTSVETRGLREAAEVLVARAYGFAHPKQSPEAQARATTFLVDKQLIDDLATALSEDQGAEGD